MTRSTRSNLPIPGTYAHDILTHLSFSHLVKPLKIDAPLKRAFYEIEAIKAVGSSAT